MNSTSILLRICELKSQQDLAPPEDCGYIQRQIDEQLGSLQCISKEPMASITQVVNKLYVLWLDGKWPETQMTQIDPASPDSPK